MGTARGKKGVRVTLLESDAVARRPMLVGCAVHGTLGGVPFPCISLHSVLAYGMAVQP